ncbi:Beta-lactamase enzyme family protein [Chitinophaga jiangningensis]|uniref:Beta-lactamase enzyme family protein n=1 Tax=Chitinophaga jiangningensis TaxID=1419482 RepID=A0A1M7E189_9BACT|nr:serine hydrolase [Chitinophaga jiangningensis]SHL85477.1 Beta-lactamase enzyme family protein [Chitinophaga jiangningensis]
MRYKLLIILSCLPLFLLAQERTDSLLQRLLTAKASPLLQRILQQPDSFRYQLIYTEINRDRQNKPHFKNYYFHVNAGRYYNPASTVKLPVAVLALEKLKTLRSKGIDRNTTMLTDSTRTGQVNVHADTSAANGLPSIGHYIKEIFLISDNDAYNRLYEFTGQQRINERLQQMGYEHTRIVRRFMPSTEEENRCSPAIRFVNKDSVLLYAQAPECSTMPFDYSKSITIGNGYFDKDDKLVPLPMDFTRHNIFALEDLQLVLQSLLFPASVPAARRFDLDSGDYRFLCKYMSAYPSETDYPRYDTAEYYNSFTKFFFFKAGHQNIPGHIRVFNKAGWSYGFLTDAAYIIDYKNKVEFMLTANIYVNSDGVLNDNKYEYEEIGYPFFRETGEIIYQYELGRKRAYTPDLNEFRINYSQ